MDRLIKVLPAIVKAAGASEEVAEAACIAAWKHAVGEGLSSHAAPLELQGRKLVIVVADNIWKTQLEQMRGQLLFKLNSILGQPLVNSLEFRVDPKILTRTNKSEDSVEGNKQRDYKVPVELLTAAAGIEDTALRRAFLGAAVSCVRRLEKPKV
ncbi:MAG TPA: DUF721 domain-containing protein [Pyrinomonadaceae bacterium]|jgi:predicted nucleic acid-binding Zn ribbon protein